MPTNPPNAPQCVPQLYALRWLYPAVLYSYLLPCLVFDQFLLILSVIIMHPYKCKIP